MRDPLTNLHVVDPQAVDKEIARQLPQYFCISGRIPLLVFVGRVTSRIVSNGHETRNRQSLLVSSKAVYFYSSSGESERCIPIDCIGRVMICQESSFIVLRLPKTYDAMFKLVDGDIDRLVEVLRTARSHCADHQPLEVSVWQNFRSLQVSLEKPNEVIESQVEVEFRSYVCGSEQVNSFLRPPLEPSSTPHSKSVRYHPLFTGRMSVEGSAAPISTNITGTHVDFTAHRLSKVEDELQHQLLYQPPSIQRRKRLLSEQNTSTAPQSRTPELPPPQVHEPVLPQRPQQKSDCEAEVSSFSTTTERSLADECVGTQRQDEVNVSRETEFLQWITAFSESLALYHQRQPPRKPTR